METVIVTSIILISVGAFATFAMAQMLPQEVLAKAEEHGRFAGLANEKVFSAKPPGTARRARKTWRNTGRTSPACPVDIGGLAPNARASRDLAR
jgi:hypothetical protein